MKNKSAEQILKDIAEHNNKESWRKFVLSSTDGEMERLTVIAMHEYAEQFKPKWVPVTERLPEKDKTVYVCIGNTVTIFGYIDALGRWWSRSEQLFRVTHWQPLPELPID